MSSTLGKSGRSWNASRTMMRLEVSGRGGRAWQGRRNRWANCRQGTHERATSRKVATSVGVKVVDTTSRQISSGATCRLLLLRWSRIDKIAIRIPTADATLYKGANENWFQPLAHVFLTVLSRAPDGDRTRAVASPADLSLFPIPLAMPGDFRSYRLLQSDFIIDRCKCSIR